jgi:two-component system, sporulation sensor kinase E
VRRNRATIQLVRISSRLSIAFSVAAIFLLSVGVAAIFLIDHLDEILSETTFYNFQSDQVAVTIHAFRLAPDKINEQLARLNDLEKWARTDEERRLISAARAELTNTRSTANAIGKLEELGTYYHGATETAHNHLLLIHHRAVLGVIVIMFDSVLLFVVLMYLVRRWLLNPLLDLREKALLVSERASSMQALTSQEGEVADLSNAITAMAAKLHDLEERVDKAERLAAVGESCAHISQNMRGMLASIRSLAHYESSAEKVGPDAQAAFSYIIATVNKLETWVRSTISMVRPADLHSAKQQLEPIIRDSLALVEPQMTEKQLEVKFDPCDDLPNVSLDRSLFEQALVSILVNAIEASPEQGHVAIRTVNGQNGNVSIRIEDEGEGMTEESKKRAFDAFFTTKIESAGLGLTVARNIIARHGGTIEIESTPKNGTALTINLPAH